MSIGSCFVCCVVFVVVAVAAAVVVGFFFFFFGWVLVCGSRSSIASKSVAEFRERETEVLGIGFLERANIFFFLGSVCFCFRV